jgi:hypothetical protein
LIICGSMRNRVFHFRYEPRFTQGKLEAVVNAKKLTKVASKFDAKPKAPLTTTGEAFPDGAIIELVSGPAGTNKPNLLLWNGTVATIASELKHDEQTYVAPEIALSLYHAIRLPTKSVDYGSLEDLFSGIVELFRNYLGLSDRQSRLLTAFSMSTWLADRLPIAPGAVISAADEGSGIEVLRLLSCICRRPLLLAEVTPSGFRCLPMHLGTTLLINQQSIKPNLQRLLRASTFRGLHLPGSHGNIVDLYGPKAILCGSDSELTCLGDGALQISISPSRSPSSEFDERKQNEISMEFQPRLLYYRLRHLATVNDSQVEGAEFTSAIRPLAGAFANCLADDQKLAHDTIRLLRPQDDDVKGKRFLDVNCVVVEILWGLVHDPKQKSIQVEELAKYANALLRSRGETIEYSAEDIGWSLSKLNIRRHTTSSGRQISLSKDNGITVHQTAAGYRLECAQRVHEGCTICDSLLAVDNKRVV